MSSSSLTLKKVWFQLWAVVEVEEQPGEVGAGQRGVLELLEEVEGAGEVVEEEEAESGLFLRRQLLLVFVLENYFPCLEHPQLSV